MKFDMMYVVKRNERLTIPIYLMTVIGQFAILAPIPCRKMFATDWASEDATKFLLVWQGAICPDSVVILEFRSLFGC